MEKRRKLNKLKVGIVIFLALLILSITVFGRYTYNAVLDAYFSAREFYFSSDILLLGGESNVYTYSGWGGVGECEFGIDLYSYDSEISKLEYDLDYTITCTSLDTDKITCTIAGTDNKTTDTGTISAVTNTSRVTILINPKTEIEEGDTVSFLVTASTTEPYQKTISRKISLHINLPDGNSYSIEDVTGRDYALLKLVNRGDTGARATVSFDPDELRLDLNDEIYTDDLVSVETTDGYISKIVFNIPAESAKNVKFYKVDKTQDYSYPGDSETSAIIVNY